MSKEEQRNMEARVAETARKLLVAMYSDAAIIGATPGPDILIAGVWDIAERFEAQAEERWRELL